MKRYIRLDVEYQFDGGNIKWMQDELMQLIKDRLGDSGKVVFSRDSPNRDELDEPRYKRPIFLNPTEPLGDYP